MIIVLVALFGLVGFILVKISHGEWEIKHLVGSVMIVFSVLVCLTLIFAHIMFFADADAEQARLQAKYDTIMYQLENNIYEDDRALRELMVEITAWNATIADCRVNQNNLWIGIFYPKIYNNFNLITF